MANGADFSRLRRQNLFDIPDINQGGIMGEIDFSGMNQDFGADGNYGEGPQYVPPNSGNIGEVNLPGMEEPFGGPSPFGGTSGVNPNIGQTPIGGPGSRGASEADELLKIINGIYTPEYTSRDRFNRLLDAAPERESPGVMRGLAAFGMGLQAKDPLDALKVHEQALYAPHHRAMADWTAKTGPFGNAAQYENTANINERTLAGTVGTQVVNQRRYDDQNAINERKNEIATFNAESNRIRQEAYAYMQRLGRGWQADVTGTTVKMWNKDTNEIIDTGMPTGKLTEEAKISLQNAGRVAAAAAVGQNAAAVAGIRGTTVWTDGTNMYSLNPAQAANAETMGLTPITPGAPPFPRGPIRPIDTTPNTAAVNPRAARNDSFQKFADERPDLAVKWLIPPVSATGNWGIKPPPGPSGGFMGWGQSINPTEMQEYNLVREALGLPPIPSNQPAQQAPPIQQQPVAKPGVGPSITPAPPQAAAPPPPPAADPFTQPQEYQDPFAQPPIQPGQNLGTVGGAVDAARASLRPQPPSPAQIMQEVAQGRRLTVTDPATGKIIGTISSANPEEINYWTTVRKMRVDAPR